MQTMTMKTFLLFMIFAWTVNRTFANIQIGLAENEKAVSTNDWGPITQSTRISIGTKAPKDTAFKTNHPVELLVRINNLYPTEEYALYVRNPLTFTEGLSLIVIAPDGKDISPTFAENFNGSGGVVRVQPMQINGFGFDLNSLCKLDQIGTYKIVLKLNRSTSDRRKVFAITSNQLNVTIIP